MIFLFFLQIQWTYLKKIFFDFIITLDRLWKWEKNNFKIFYFIQDKINIGGYFLNINRYVKSVVGDDIYFKDYPYDDFNNTF